MDASCQQNPAGKSLETITSRVEPNRLPTSPPPPRATFSTLTPHGEVGGELRFGAATLEVIGEMADVEPTTAASRRRHTRRFIMASLLTYAGVRCEPLSSIMLAMTESSGSN